MEACYSHQPASTRFSIRSRARDRPTKLSTLFTCTHEAGSTSPRSAIFLDTRSLRWLSGAHPYFMRSDKRRQSPSISRSTRPPKTPCQHCPNLSPSHPQPSWTRLPHQHPQGLTPRSRLRRPNHLRARKLTPPPPVRSQRSRSHIVWSTLWQPKIPFCSTTLSKLRPSAS